jgi:S1-C subfamily serine protease
MFHRIVGLNSIKRHSENEMTCARNCFRVSVPKKATIISALSLLALIFLITGPISFQSANVQNSGEGLFDPNELRLPARVKESLAGIVRVDSNIRFRLTVFDSDDEASTARKHPGAREKQYLPGGGVIWPILMSRSSLRELCGDTAAAAQPGLHELCAAEGSVLPPLPRTILTESVYGTASGFVVARLETGHYVIATAFHVAREAIERTGREQGVRNPKATRAVDLSVLVSSNPADKMVPYVPVDHVNLLANASRDEWKKGEDWALLTIPAKGLPPLKVLQLAKTTPNIGERVWVFGFPTRTVRNLSSSTLYTNANGDLRVTAGVIVEDPDARKHSSPSDLLSTADGVAGDSGGAVVNDRGEVVGIFRHHTATDGEVDLRIARYSGFAQIVPVMLFSDVLKSITADKHSK